VRRARMSLTDIDFFVPNTPLAWFADLFADTLGIDRARTVSTYAQLANMGPALNPHNLYEAIASGRLQQDETALLFSIGSVATAAAAVVRLGDIRLGTMVEH